MKVNKAPKIWEFDVDNTLILWDRSKYPDLPRIDLFHVRGPVELVVHQKNVNLLIKLAKIGWYIRVHSGSGPEWAAAVVRALGLEEFVDEVCVKPLGETDDMPAGDGVVYRAYRNPKTGEES